MQSGKVAKKIIENAVKVRKYKEKPPILSLLSIGGFSIRLAEKEGFELYQKWLLERITEKMTSK